MKSTIASAATLLAAASALPHTVILRCRSYVAPKRATGVQYFGVNIAGFDFGCATNAKLIISQGTCVTTQVYPPLSALGGPDGAGQMSHFAKDNSMNIFRLPVGWQYLLNNNLGGTLDGGNFGKYDQLVQACLATGASCIVDVNARWNGQIIGQGGPTNDQFANVWSQLATKYASKAKVIFGLMNEPHDVPDINAWAKSVQAAVTAIRKVESQAGGSAHMILIPGNDWTSAAAFPTKSGPALLNVTNPDGSTTGLVFDVHKYSDSDNSGTHTECTTDNISTAFAPLAAWLRTNKRQALNSEMGGGNTASCQQYICAQVKYVNQNADVYLGYVGWSAGSFDPRTYELSEVPTKNGNTWTDTALVKSCFKNTA
ncbi:glycoside hydrolase family 5 protein [Xylariaceae sp. FL1651]|nr:glycoside hydrolase family 5 protein [Xylariaceae sp. FL1651]